MTDQQLLDDSWIDSENLKTTPDDKPKRDPNADRRLGLTILAVAVAAVIVAQFAVGGIIVPVILFLIVIVPMVLFHEWGHFYSARKFGIACKEFFVGFGPRLWSFKRGETEYGIKVGFPAGGYVRIVGMSQYEEVEDRFKGRTFRDAKAWKRAVVLAAGSATHFFTALVLIFLLLVLYGNRFAPPDQLTELAVIGEDSPAAAAGLDPGDDIVSINGETLQGDWAAVRESLRAKPGQEVAITYERDGQLQTTTATLDSVDEEGTQIGMLGVSPDIEWQHVGALEAVPKTFTSFGDIWLTSMVGLGDVFSPSNLKCIGNQISGGDCVTPNRFVSPVGVASLADYAAASGIATFMMLLIVINIFVGTLNLLPLLPFDGGHLAVLGYEQVASKIKRKPVEVDQAKLIPITVGVLGLLGVIFLSSLYLDVTAGLPIP